jgi:hypothetical protein
MAASLQRLPQPFCQTTRSGDSGTYFSLAVRHISIRLRVTVAKYWVGIDCIVAEENRCGGGLCLFILTFRVISDEAADNLGGQHSSLSHIATEDIIAENVIAKLGASENYDVEARKQALARQLQNLNALLVPVSQPTPPNTQRSDPVLVGAGMQFDAIQCQCDFCYNNQCVTVLKSMYSSLASVSRAGDNMPTTVESQTGT